MTTVGGNCVSVTGLGLPSLSTKTFLKTTVTVFLRLTPWEFLAERLPLESGPVGTAARLTPSSPLAVLESSKVAVISVGTKPSCFSPSLGAPSRKVRMPLLRDCIAFSNVIFLASGGSMTQLVENNEPVRATIRPIFVFIKEGDAHQAYSTELMIPVIQSKRAAQAQ